MDVTWTHCFECRARFCLKCLPEHIQSCEPTYLQLLKLNDDWSCLELCLKPGENWKEAFAVRQISVRETVVKHLALPSVLAKIVGEYIVRSWSDFEVGDLINVKDVTVEIWYGAVVVSVSESSMVVHLLYRRSSCDMDIPRSEYARRISEFDMSITLL